MKKNGLIALVIVLLLTITILANTGMLPKSIRQLYDFPYGDKVGHFFLMGLANFALGWATLASHPDPKPASVIWKVSLVFTLVITLEEFSQQFFSRRTFSFMDLGFSYAGVVIFAVGLYFLKR